jgi:hypothetical protein
MALARQCTQHRSHARVTSQIATMGDWSNLHSVMPVVRTSKQQAAAVSFGVPAIGGVRVPGKRNQSNLMRQARKPAASSPFGNR